MKNKPFKIICLLFLFFLISANLHFSQKTPDKLTNYKLQFFSLNGADHFIGSLNLWYFFAQNNDWDLASKLDLNLNQTEIFKSNHQPSKLAQKLDELKSKVDKDAQDYLILAKTQSVLGLNQDAVESIKQAHKIDAIRSDLDQLFYSVTN